MAPTLRALAVNAALVCCVAMVACGGSSTPATTTTTESGPALPESEIPALNRADVEIFASANATKNLVRNPGAVKRARQLLKPLIVAKTLHVKPSNQVAGGLVQGLTGELDSLVPGLTSGNGSNERLDSEAVHRFLTYGSEDPTQVFRPRVADGIAGLEKLLRGKPAETRVTSAGVDPPQTARQLVLSDLQVTRGYWPDLARRLQKLNGSLR